MVSDDGFDLKIATARIGDNFLDVAGKMGEKWVGQPAGFGGVWCSIAGLT